MKTEGRSQCSPWARWGVALCALAVSTAHGQAPSAPSAEVDAIFARYDRSDTPGCALGVYQDGRMTYARGYGIADLTHGIPISPTTVFYIGSTAKQFTAFAVSLLAERGALSLADSVREHIPELPEWGDSITIEHLLHHTSGLRDYLGLWSMSGRSFADEIPIEQAIELIARQRALNFAPGTQWSYSNSGYVLLAEIVGRVTGTSLRELMHDEVFAPLGMEATLFYDDNGKIVADRADGYQPDGSGGYRLVRTSYALVGDGGLLTTVTDLLHWDENFYRNDPVGGKALIDELASPGSLDNGEPVPYAAGLVPGMHRGLPIVQHGGGFVGFRAQLLRFPTEHFSVAVLCNDATANAEGLALQVADVYLAGRLDPLPEPSPSSAPVAAAVNVDPANLERLVGRYSPLPNFLLSAVIVDEGLVLEPPPGAGAPVPLTPTSATTFVTPVLPGEIRFVLDDQGEPSLLLPGIGQTEPAPRLPPVPSLAAEELAAYVGRYTSEELDTWYQLRAAEGLELRRRYQPWETLVPIAPDRFGSANGELQFDRDEDGGVTGLELSAPRVDGVVFEKESAERLAERGPRG